MARTSYTRVLLHGWFSIAVCSIVGLVLALAISLIQPLKYSSTVRLLVRQNLGDAVDAYTASRSEERIADNLATSVYYTEFFDKVANAGFSIDPNYFPKEDYKRRREWGKTVSATVSRGTGLLTISSYHSDVTQAEQITRAVAFVLTQNAAEYTSGSDVVVRLVDAPLNSRWPVKPNVLSNAFSGLVLGGLVGVGFVLLQAERIRRRHQLVHEDFE